MDIDSLVFILFLRSVKGLSQVADTFFRLCRNTWGQLSAARKARAAFPLAIRLLRRALVAPVSQYFCRCWHIKLSRLRTSYGFQFYPDFFGSIWLLIPAV